MNFESSSTYQYNFQTCVYRLRKGNTAFRQQEKQFSFTFYANLIVAAVF